ncbi:MAG: LysR family transcriptional regulator [Clostridia bacterium]|nr:LysR family transcriptional regulator [Clostridia bacterium]
MYLRDLEYFIEICTVRSLTKAAKNVYATQPAMSAAVKRLETELQGELLVRQRKKFELTELGEMLYEAAKRMVAEREEIFLRAADITDNANRTITIGITASYGRTFLPYVYSEFHRKNPRIKTRFVVCHCGDLKDKLNQGEIDAAIMWTALDDDSFSQKVLFHERMILVMRMDDPNNKRGFIHEKYNKPFINLSDLKDAPFLSYSGERTDLCEIVNAVCKEAKYAPNVQGRFNQSSIILSMVLSGLGVGLVPWNSAVNGDMRLISDSLRAYNVFGVKAQRCYIFAYKEGKYLSKSVLSLQDACLASHEQINLQSDELQFFAKCAEENPGTTD